MNLARVEQLCTVASKTRDPIHFLAKALVAAPNDHQRSCVWLAYILLTGHAPPIRRYEQWQKIEATVRAFIEQAQKSDKSDRNWLRVHSHSQIPVIREIAQISDNKLHVRKVGKQSEVHVPNLTQDYDVPHPSDEARDQMKEWRKSHGIPYVGPRMIRKKKRVHDSDWGNATSLL